jgi:GntR family transcriptional regulator
VSIDRTSDRPVYKQLADLLREGIRSSEFPAGAELPSETELMRRFDVSRNTVRNAVALLRVEGLVSTEHGRATYVAERKPLRTLRSSRYSRTKRQAGRSPLRAEAEEQGRTSSRQLREVAVVPAPIEIADRLELEAGISVVVRRYLMFYDNEPTQTADSYFPPEIAEGTRIAEAADLPAGVHAELEQQLGYELDRFVEELTFRMPTPEEARALSITAGVPVVRLLRTLYARSGKPLEVSDFLLAGDRHVLVYEVSAG